MGVIGIGFFKDAFYFGFGDAEEVGDFSDGFAFFA